MITLLVWTVAALGAAVLVMVIASVSNGQAGGMRTFLRDLRAGLQERRTRGTAEATAAPEPEPVDATFDEFFAAAQVDDEPYIQVDDLTDTLSWAREQATRATRAGRSVASRSVGLVRR